VDDSAFAGAKVNAGVGVDERVEEVDEDGAEPEVFVSLLNRILFGSVVSISWIRSSSDPPVLDDLGSGPSTDMLEGPCGQLSDEALCATGLALDIGVKGEKLPEASGIFLLLDFRGSAGIVGAYRSSSLVLNFKGSTCRDGVARGVRPVDSDGVGSRSSEPSNSASGVLTGESAPVNCFKAFDGVLSGD
jgi:hypothetical protein